MLYRKTLLFVAALGVGFVLSTAASVHAERTPVAGPPPMPPVPTMWTDPPEAVRTAAAAMRAACADWQQERPLPANPSPAEAVHPRPSEVTVCEAALDPDEVRTMQVTSYAVFAVAGVGLAGATFVTVMFLLRMLVSGLSRVAVTSWEAWPSSRRSLQGMKPVCFRAAMAALATETKQAYAACHTDGVRPCQAASACSGSSSLP